ncbi:MAG: hypothetical protein GSR74_01310 [Desulfurococcales archaeon]|nr:hypothetical protein [Desulfurococcales archaeon]
MILVFPIIATSQPNIYYRFDVALLPPTLNASAVDLNKLYLINNHIVFHGLVSYNGYEARIVKIYFSGLNTQYTIRIVNDIMKLANSLSRKAVPVSSEEYYILAGKKTELVYCSRMLRAQSGQVDILYSPSKVPLRGVVILGTYYGSKIAAYFEILSSNLKVCGVAVTGQGTKTGLLLVTVLIGLGSVPAYLYYRRNGARGNDTEM